MTNTNDPIINATHLVTSDVYDITLNKAALDVLRMVLTEKHGEVIRLADHKRGLQASHPRPVLAVETLADGTVITRAQRGVDEA